MSDEEPTSLLAKAAKCRALARTIGDARTRALLIQMAQELEQKARASDGDLPEMPPQS